MEKTGAEKASLLLICVGMALAGAGAGMAFFLAATWIWLFYAGFMTAIAGFAAAVLGKSGRKE